MISLRAVEGSKQLTWQQLEDEKLRAVWTKQIKVVVDR